MSPNGKTIVFERPATWGGWKAFAPEQIVALPLQEQLAFWCTTLRHKETEIGELLALGYAVSIDCYYSATEPDLIELDTSLLTQLAALGVDVDIHVSPP